MSSAQQQLVVVDQKELVRVSNETAIAFKMDPEKSQALIATYGLEAVQTALEVKKDGITVSLGYFLRLCEKTGLSPETIGDLYQVRHEIQGNNENRSPGELKNSVSVVTLAALAKYFPDFREMPVEDKVDEVKKLHLFYQRSSFKRFVALFLRRAKELNFHNIQDLTEAMEEYANGDLFRTFFPDWDLGIEGNDD